MALVFYSAETGLVRRIVKNSDGEDQSDDELAAFHKANDDEEVMRAEVRPGMLSSLEIADLQQEVSTTTGLFPPAEEDG